MTALHTIILKAIEAAGLKINIATLKGDDALQFSDTERSVTIRYMPNDDLFCIAARYFTNRPSTKITVLASQACQILESL